MLLIVSVMHLLILAFQPQRLLNDSHPTFLPRVPLGTLALITIYEKDTQVVRSIHPVFYSTFEFICIFWTYCYQSTRKAAESSPI